MKVCDVSLTDNLKLLKSRVTVILVNRVDRTIKALLFGFKLTVTVFGIMIHEKVYFFLLCFIWPVFMH